MKLYRQVSTGERMPDKEGEYFTISKDGFYQNALYSFKHGMLCKQDVEWWIEEVEIPSEDDIFRDGVKMGYTENDYSLGVFKDGAEYILNKLKG